MRKYRASRDYGTRNSEREKFRVNFAGHRATVYRRGDSDSLTWHMRVYLPSDGVGSKGTHYRRSLNTTDRREAVEFAQREFLKLLSAEQSGQRVISPTLMEVVRDFRLDEDRELAAGTISKRTHALHHFYTQRAIAYAKDRFSSGINTRMADIDGKRDFAAYLEWRESLSKVSRATVTQELVGIRMIFKFAVKQRMANDKCVPQWDFNAGETPRRQRMNDGDYNKVVNILRKWCSKASGEIETYNHQLLRHVFLIMANCGARTGEILQLRNDAIQSINRDTGEVVVRIRAETSKVRKERLIVITPSHGGREGGAPINYMIRWLDEHQRHKAPTDFIFALFTKPDKPAVDPFYRGFMSLREELAKEKLEWWDAYHCRHYYATQAIRAGHPLAVIANALGNSVAVVERHYSHLLSEQTSRLIGSARSPRSSRSR